MGESLLVGNPVAIPYGHSIKNTFGCSGKWGVGGTGFYGRVAHSSRYTGMSGCDDNKRDTYRRRVKNNDKLMGHPT